MRTQLDSIHTLFEEAYGEGEAAQLFTGDYGIVVVHPDTKRRTRTILNPVNWTHFSRLLATGWQIEKVYNRQTKTEWDYLDFELHVWIDVALAIDSQLVGEILQPLKPLRIEEHPNMKNFWLLIFAEPMNGMDKWLLANCAGVKLLTRGEPIGEGHSPQNPEIGYGIVVTSMAALHLPQ